MASKGQKFKHWSKEEKLRIVKKIVEEGKSSYAVAKEENILSTGMIRHWTKLYIEQGENALETKKKPGNPLTKYSRRKVLSKEEQLQMSADEPAKEKVKKEVKSGALKYFN